MKVNRYESLSETDRKGIVSAFEAGVPIDKIRETYGVTRLTVGKALNDATPPQLVNKDVVVKYTDDKWAIDRIACFYSVDSSVISKILKVEGEAIREWGVHSRTRSFEEGYFSTIDSSEKAYWLGFIYGDGNVDNRMQQIHIGLQRRDRDHLLKWSDSIGLKDAPVRDFSRRGGVREFEYSSLTLSSKKMSLDLISLGVVPAKSATIHPPTLKADLKPHFIRGLWDADGHIGRNVGGREVSLAGNRQTMLWVQESIGVDTNVRPHKSSWSFKVNSPDKKRVLEMMYSGSELHLDRKKEAAMELINYYDA